LKSWQGELNLFTQLTFDTDACMVERKNRSRQQQGAEGFELVEQKAIVLYVTMPMIMLKPYYELYLEEVALKAYGNITRRKTSSDHYCMCQKNDECIR